MERTKDYELKQIEEHKNGGEAKPYDSIYNQIQTNRDQSFIMSYTHSIFFLHFFPLNELYESNVEKNKSKSKGDSCQEAVDKVKMNKNEIETNKTKHKIP